jgi:hypothetical protein
MPMPPSRLPPLTRCSASTAAVTPDAVPADRSISPSSRTKTRPIAMIVTPAPWASRFAMLPRVRKLSEATENSTSSTIRPNSAGNEPSSPPRTRAR